MSSEIKELAVHAAMKNKNIAYQERDSAWSFVRDMDELEKWIEIREKVYNPDSCNHWRLQYSTYEEALEAERDSFNILLNTPEYKAYSVAHNKLKAAQKAVEEAKKLDEENFDKARA